MPNYAKKGFIWLWYFLASLIILFAVVGSLVKALTPVLNDHIPTLEKTLEKYLHQDVTIGSVNINWATFGPEFHFNDIIIYNEKKVLVKADELMAHIGIWRSLFKRSLFLRSFTLDGVDLDVVEVTKHKYSINGFGDFAMNILLIYYVTKGASIIDTQTKINLEILKRFNEEGLEFAFPTQTLYTVKQDG